MSTVNKTKPLGYILWEGLSPHTQKPIVAIATGFGSKSSNRKTGPMIQVYILSASTHPLEAIKSGEDSSICGDCIHRGDGDGGERTCYVTVTHGPRAVYDAYKRGRYETEWSPEVFAGRIVRLGTYGDPAFIPLHILKDILKLSAGHTGYTHQWENNRVHLYKEYLMASTDDAESTIVAQQQGWRTFRVHAGEDDVLLGKRGRLPKEVLCPASEEAGKKLTCQECLACGGGDRQGSIYIPAHGSSAVMKYVAQRIAA